MPRIATVKKGKATGRLKGLYEEVQKEMGYVSNISSAMSLWPDFLKGSADLYTSVMLRLTKLPRGLKEVIAAVVSKFNRCEYSFLHHVRLAKKYGIPEQTAESLKGDYVKSRLFEDRVVHLLEYAEKVAGHSDAVQRDDLEALRAAGWADRDILETTAIAALTGFNNRIVGALGIEMEDRQSPKKDPRRSQ